MVLARWQATIVDDEGNVQDGASVEVRREVAGAPLATIYSDRAGETPLGNPMTADPDGFAAFHAVGGAYRITATKGGFSRVWRYVGIGLASEQDTPPVGVSWRFDDATADADPGPGLFRFNNADPASATEIYIDAVDADEIDQGGWIETLDDGGGSGDRGTLILRSVDNAALIVATVTGGITADGSPAGYYTIPIAVLAASDADSFASGAVFGLMFGRAGVDGDGIGDVVGPAGGVVDNEFVYFNAATGKAIKGSSLLVADVAATRAATANRVLLAARLNDAAAFFALTDDATIAINWTAFINARVTLTTDRVLGNPTNEIPGQWRTIEVMSDGGPDELTFGSEYEVFPTLDDIATDKSYLVHIFCLAASRFRAYADEGGDPT